MKKIFAAIVPAFLFLWLAAGCSTMKGAYCWDDHMAVPCFQGRWECEEQPGDPCEICVCEPYEWMEEGPSPYP